MSDTNIEKLLFQVTNSMASMTRLWQKLAYKRLEQYGVSSGCIGPFLLIGRADGELSQVQLAQQLGIEGPSLVRSLDKLADARLIRRESHESDRRSNRLSLTEKGKAIHPGMERDLTAMRRQVFADMTAPEIQAVLKLYRLLGAAA